MTRTQVTTVIICAVFLGLASCRSPVETISAGVPELDDNFETDTLVIEADDGSHHEFTVYLAIEPEQQRRGLMFVRKMPADRGMLFVYDVSDNHCHAGDKPDSPTQVDERQGGQCADDKQKRRGQADRLGALCVDLSHFLEKGIRQEDEDDHASDTVIS